MRLYRSQRDKKLFGVCGGLAQSLNVDATLLRLIVVVTAFFSGGTVILLYLLATLVIPKEPLAEGMSIHSCSTRHREESTASGLDEMMKDIEKKAMWKEIEQLRAKVAKYEKGEV